MLNTERSPPPGASMQPDPSQLPLVPARFCALDTEGGCVLAVGRVAAIELVRLAGRRVKKVVILAPARTQQPPQN